MCCARRGRGQAHDGEPRTTQAIADALASVVEREQAFAIHFPLGLFHRDHRCAGDASAMLVDRLATRDFRAYEDAIYRRIAGAVDERLQALRARGLALAPITHSFAAGTAEALARRDPRVDVVRLPRNLGAAGRNAGARACTTPYVAFCDDDTWWTRESLRCAADVLDSHTTLAAVTARVLVGDAGRDDLTNARMAASPLPNTLGVNGSELLGLLGGACMVRRDAFLAVGGYDPHLFLGGEEALLAIDLMSAGWRMAYVRGAVVHHHPSGARDAGARRRLALRNALWLAWLRRPPRRALETTRAWWAQSLRDGELWRNAADALRGLPWIVRSRRVVPPHVEQALRIVETFYATERGAPPLRARSSPARPG